MTEPIKLPTEPAKAPPAPPRLKPSILEQAKPVGGEKMDLSFYRAKILVGGKTGSGKSTLLTTLPGKKLFIDYDQRRESLYGFENVDVIDCPEPDPRSPQAWARAEDIRKEIWALVRQDKFHYSSVIEDGLGSMSRYCLNWCMLLNPKRGFGGAPVEGHYGAHGVNLLNHIDSMAGLPCHYALTCHLSVEKDETDGSVVYFPKADGKKFPQNVPPLFNEVWRMTRSIDEKTKKNLFLLYTSGGEGSRYDFFKSSLNHLGQYWTDPITVDISQKPAGFEKLLALRFRANKP
ncbi:MAG: AAA family ATPase [Candidatus Izemoplasmatales bacterium]